MPKRTNQFQSVVAYIAAELAPHGATVRESVELDEIGLNAVRREVDTLIEADAGIATIRIAIEARDRKRKATVQWIDELIGKYAKLPVDRVVAVSSSGFTKGAAAKAASNNIAALTPEEISAVDWPDQFQRLGAVHFSVRPEISRVSFHTMPGFPRKVEASDVLRSLDETGAPARCTFSGFLEYSAPRLFEKAKALYMEKRNEFYKVKGDLKKPMHIAMELKTSDVYLEDGDESYAVLSILFVVTMQTNVSDIPVTHRAIAHKALLTEVAFGDQRHVIAQKANAQEGRLFRNSTKKSLKAEDNRHE